MSDTNETLDVENPRLLVADLEGASYSEITLRDLFALALISGGGGGDWEEWADHVYRSADEFLIARAKNPGP